MSLGHGPSIVRDGLISQIDFANSKIGSGNTKTNLVQGANPFVGINSPSVSNGIFSANGLNPGTAFGESVVSTALGDHGTNSFTYQFLINPKASTSFDNANQARIYEQSGWPDTYHIFQIDHNSGNPYYNFYLLDLNSTATQGFITPAGTAVLNQWVFLTCMVDRDTGFMRIYINETKYEAAKSFGTQAYGNADPIRFPSSYAELQADYSCVLFYNRALLDSEVSQNFNALRGRFDL